MKLDWYGDSLYSNMLEDVRGCEEKYAKLIAADAKSNAASGPLSRTGNLSKGISARKSKYKDGGWIVVTHPPAYHAALVEFGTRRMRVATGKRRATGKGTTPRGLMRFFAYGKWITIEEVAPMPAKPFLRPAFAKYKGVAEQEIAYKVGSYCK